MRVQQILKSKGNDMVVTVPPATTVREATAILAKHGIGAVIVSSDGGKTAEGILSERDIVRELSGRGGEVLTEPVMSVMTSKLSTCISEQDADDVLKLMTEGRFRHMPVLGANGALVGVITLGDVVKARLSELAMEKNALEGMIMGH